MAENDVGPGIGVLRGAVADKLNIDGDAVDFPAVKLVLAALPEVVKLVDGLQAEVLSLREDVSAATAEADSQLRRANMNESELGIARTALVAMTEERDAAVKKVDDLNAAMHRCTTAYAELEKVRDHVLDEIAKVKAELEAMSEKCMAFAEQLKTKPESAAPASEPRTDHSGRPRGWQHK